MPHLTLTCRRRVGDYTWKAMGPGRPSRASPSLCDLDRSLPSPLNCPCSACWLRPGHQGFRSEQGGQGPGPRGSPFWEQEMGTRSLMNDQVMRAGGHPQPQGLVCRVGVSWRGQPPGGGDKVSGSDTGSHSPSFTLEELGGSPGSVGGSRCQGPGPSLQPGGR